MRVWAKLDDAFAVLRRHLELPEVDMKALAPSYKKDVFTVPYDENGILDHSKRMRWDLRQGRQPGA